jgi:hypothetical protein
MVGNLKFTFLGFLLFFFSCRGQIEKEQILGKYIDLEVLAPNGVLATGNISFTPDSNGVLQTYEIKIPEYSRCIYFAKDVPQSSHDGMNKAYPFILEGNLKSMNDGVMSILFKLNDGSFISLTAMAGGKSMSWFHSSDEGKLLVSIGNLGIGNVDGDLPLFSWSKSDDLYKSCSLSWNEAVKSPLIGGSTDMRDNKTYPEMFKYLGWCSWEQYKLKIDEKILVDAAENIEKSNIPIRYLLVDDGHQTRQKKTRGQKIRSFYPDTVKFPNGWQPLLKLRKEDKIKWIGLWHSFNGDWNGLSADNDFDVKLNSHLEKTPKGIVQPKNNTESSRYFYNSLIESVKDFGFDFVKIDVQTRNVGFYIGSDNAVTASATNSQSLEEAVNRDLHGLINCMAQNTVCVFNTKYSSITRVSKDYQLGNAFMAKSHLWQSYHNIPWQGQTVWGDHDMFHSSDPFAGEVMAISKAMSGGPIYLSDDPVKFLPEYITPLCFEDGLLLRPIAPGTPLPASMFVNPLKEEVVYSVIAPLENGAASIVAYNLLDTVNPTTLKGSINPDDYKHAGAMVQPYNGKWDIPQEGLLLYDWHLKKAQKLDAAYNFEIPVLANRLFHLCPIKKGWAVVGCTEKYLSPAVVTKITATKTSLKINLKESGSIVIWNETGKVLTKSGQIKSLGNNLWQVDIPKGEKDFQVTLENVN